MKKALFVLTFVYGVLFGGWAQANYLNEGFEGSLFPPAGWTRLVLQGGASSVSQYYNDQYLTAHSGDYCAMMYYVNPSSYASGDRYLITPKLSPVPGDSLVFWIETEPEWFTNTLTLEVSVTGTAAADFTPLRTFTLADFPTEDWLRFAVDMSDYAGQDIYVAFHDIQSDGADIAIDDVSGVQRYVTVCNPLPVTDDTPYLQDFATIPECWDYTSGSAAWNLSSNGYLSHGFGTYACDAVTPVFDISALSTPFLQFSERRPDYNSSGIADQLSVSYRDAGSGDTTWTPLISYTDVVSSWRTDSLPLPQGLNLIQLKFTAVGMGSSANGCYLDDVRVYAGDVNACLPVVLAPVSDITSTTVTVSWSGFSDNGYDIRYRAEGDAEWTPYGTSTGTSVFLDNLVPATTYTVEVSPVCEPMVYVALNFTTPMEAEPLPYFTDFSNGTSEAWLLNNGTCANRWNIGNPANFSDFSALYISSDSTTAGYYDSAYSVVSAEKLFQTGDAESLIVSFDVQVGGESYYDYLKVFLAPASATYAPAATYTSYSSYSYSSNALNFGQYLNQTGYASYPYKLNLTNGNMLHVEVIQPNPAPNGQAKIVFVWVNDNNSGVQPGAVVTNVQVRELTCPAPTGLSVSDIGQHSATLSWTAADAASTYLVQYKTIGQNWSEATVVSVTDTFYNILSELTPVTNYNVRVAADCGTDSSAWVSASFTTACGTVTVTDEQPYLQDFTASPQCWTLNTGSASWLYYTSNGYIYHSYGNYSCDAVTPEFDISALDSPYLKFSQKRASYNNSGLADELSIYYRDANDADSVWVLITTLTDVVANWRTDSLPLPIGVSPLQLKFTANGIGSAGSGCYLDNVTVYGTNGNGCPPLFSPVVSNVTATTAEVAWSGLNENGYNVRYMAEGDADWSSLGTLTATSILLDNLTPMTSYIVEVASNCDELQYHTISFTTTMVPASLPYSTDFSATTDNEWLLNNGSCTNQWIIGGPANFSGVNALYISDDNATAEYYDSAYSVVSAEKLFEVGNAETIEVSFDVQVGGESSYDYLKVFLAPSTAEYPAANGYTTFSSPSYSTNALNFGQYLNLTGNTSYPYKFNLTNDTMLHVEIEGLNPAPGGLTKLVFVWVNDGNAGTQPGAVITNVSVKELTCTPPTGLTVSNIGLNSATVSWNAHEYSDGYILQYKTSSQSWDEATVVNMTDTLYDILSGLVSSMNYQVRVATDCGTDTSVWSTTSFTTECGTIVLTDTEAYLQDFSTSPACWDLIAGTANWSYGNGNISHGFGTYTCEALTPVFDLSAVTVPYLKFDQRHSDYNNSGLSDHLSVYYRDANAADTLWTLITTYMDVVANWRTDSLPLPQDIALLQLKFTANGIGSTGNGCYLDNVTVYNNSNGCPPVLQLTVSNVTSNSAEVTWNGFSDNGYEVRYKTDSDSSWTSMGTVTDAPVTLSNLLPARNYTVEVSSECDVMTYVSAAFTTPMVPAVLPYFTDFTGDMDGEWMLNNGSCSSRWTIGSPINYSNYNALYVSSDNTTAGYDTASYSIISAEKIFQTGSVEHVVVSFDALIGGESSYDFLKVFLAPAEAEYPAATEYMPYASYSNTNNALDFSDFVSQTGNSSYPYKLNLTNGNMLHVEVVQANPAPNGMAKLVFVWKNDGMYGMQPGAIVTNVHVRELTCPAPTDLTVSNIGPSSATVSWNSDADAYLLQYKPAYSGWDSPEAVSVNVAANTYDLNGLYPSTNYEVRVAADCGTDTSLWTFGAFTTGCAVITVTDNESYVQDFTVFPQCWDLAAGAIAWGHNSYSGYLYHNYGSYTCEALTPVFDLTAVSTPYLKFAHKHADFSSSGLSDSLKVYFRTSVSDSWTLLAAYGEVTPDWTVDSVALTNVSDEFQLKFVAIGVGMNGNGCYVDDVTIYNADGFIPAVSDPTVTTTAATAVAQTSATLNGTITNPDNVTISAKGFQWKTTTGGTYQTVNATGTGLSYNLTGLTAATGYTFRAFITFNGQTVYGNEMTFTTLEQGVEPCDVPTGLHTTDIQNESVTIAWDANPNVSSWNIQYRKQGTNPWSTATANTNSYTISNLDGNTDYEIQVQADCGNGNQSDWTASATAHTTNVGIDSWMENSVKVFPNPANDFVNVQCTMYNVQMSADLHVFDVYGKLVQTVPMTGETTAINVTGLADGMYFVRVTTEAGAATKTFVVKR